MFFFFRSFVIIGFVFAFSPERRGEALNSSGFDFKKLGSFNDVVAYQSLMALFSTYYKMPLPVGLSPHSAEAVAVRPSKPSTDDRK